MTNDEIIKQLVDIYYEHEPWHKAKLNRKESYEYHLQLFESGNIIIISDRDILCGYVEYWRISFEQFGWIICGEPFSATHQDILRGQIAYVANTFIRPEYRNSEVYKKLRSRFFEVNSDCTHFCGTARRKKSEPVKVFKRKDVESWVTREKTNGDNTTSLLGIDAQINTLVT